MARCRLAVPAGVSTRQAAAQNRLENFAVTQTPLPLGIPDEDEQELAQPE